MTRKSVTILMIVAAFLAVFMLASPASAKIGEPCPPPNSDRVCIDHDNDPDTPPIHVPPGLFRVCNDDNPKNDNKNCEKIRPPEPTCPPATGPISGVVQQISDGIRDGGGGQLADVIDQVNCELIVGVLGL
jgi:hypothetical protein